MKEKRIIPLNYKQEDDLSSWYWTALSDDGIRKGFWIQQKETKRMWQNEVNARRKRAIQIDYTSEPEATCECQDKFDLKDCVLEVYPLGKCCRKDVYEQVSDRLSGNVEGDCFHDLLPRHKRWAMYWYYSVNILGVTGKKRKKLPTCFVQYVRNYYPDPVGECYTGFKEHGGDSSSSN